MSSETLPISPGRFAEAIRDLSAASLHLKTLEIRNSLAHLAYSNSQLRPFAEGALAPIGAAAGEPDPDCVDAIRENEVVMARMRERVGIIRAEVERRGLAWAEFEAPQPPKDDDDDDDDEVGLEVGGASSSSSSSGAAAAAAAPLTNGVSGRSAGGGGVVGGTAAAPSSGRNPWADGTFQTGVIRNGEVHMDAVPGHGGGAGAATTTTTTTTATTATRNTTAAAAGPGQGTANGGRLSDEELRRLLEERLSGDGDDEDGGLHL